MDMPAGFKGAVMLSSAVQFCTFVRSVLYFGLLPQESPSELAPETLESRTHNPFNEQSQIHREPISPGRFTGTTCALPTFGGVKTRSR